MPTQSNGQAALYQRLNGLIRAYGLENTSGPDYAPLDPASLNPGQQAENEKGRTKYRSLYPGVYVTTTVEGSYQNLRRFIREIETGRDFVVISAVELAPSDTEGQKQTEKTNPSTDANPLNPNPIGAKPNGKGIVPVTGPNLKPGQPQGPPQAKGKAHGETVSLHLEMAAYFRRPGFVPTSAP